MKRVPSESILIREGVVESEQVDDDNNENTSCGRYVNTEITIKVFRVYISTFMCIFKVCLLVFSE